MQALPFPSFWSKLPKDEENNVWYESNDSQTAIVFVHGIFSDSRNAWSYIHATDSSKSQYWPDLVLEDTTFERPSIFLGGFHTAIDSGRYDAKGRPSRKQSELLLLL